MIKPKEIEKMSKKVKDDVCQLGLVIADKYGKDEADYNDIWTAAQDTFDEKFEGKPYKLIPATRKIYAKQLAKYLNSQKYKNKWTIDR